jgi:hypothetical protein
LETRPPLGHARSMTWRRPAWSSSMARNTIWPNSAPLACELRA